MKIIGLAGGSGAGKNKAAEYFREFGINSIDTDVVSREVTKKGSPCLAELVSFFSELILNGDGSLDRKRLGELAFADKEKLTRLNFISHKHILEECGKFITAQNQAGKDYAIINAPVLFESRYNERCDIIISVIAEFDLRVKRITARDNISGNAAERRIYTQKCNEFLILKSDFIIFNNRSENDLRDEVKKVCEDIFARY